MPQYVTAPIREEMLSLTFPQLLTLGLSARVRSSQRTDVTLGEAASQGWRLVSVVPEGGRNIAYLEKP